ELDTSIFGLLACRIQPDHLSSDLGNTLVQKASSGDGAKLILHRCDPFWKSLRHPATLTPKSRLRNQRASTRRTNSGTAPGPLPKVKRPPNLHAVRVHPAMKAYFTPRRTPPTPLNMAFCPLLNRSGRRLSMISGCDRCPDLGDWPPIYHLSIGPLGTGMK